MVRLDFELYLILLEYNKISYEEYCDYVPDIHRPKEYKTYTLFLKNKGKASRRISKEAEWHDHGLLKEAQENWEKHFLMKNTSN